MRTDGRRRSGWATFLVPSILAAASCFGLVASLVGDGVWDWLGAAALLMPVLAMGIRPFGGSTKPRRDR